MAGGGAVVHVADYGASYSGTFIASLRALAAASEELGLRTAFAVSRAQEQERWVEELRRDGFPVHLLDRDAPLRARAAAIADVATREDAAIVHTHFGVYDVPAAVAALRAGRRYEVVWHRHNGFPPQRSLSSIAKDALKMRVLGRSAWTVAVSAAMRDEAVAHGFPAERAFLVENGVDLARVTRSTAPRSELRARLGLSPTARVALLFGWDPERKGVDLALDAVAELAPRRDAVLLLVGGEPLRTFVRDRVGTDLPRHVRVVAPQEHVGDLFCASDLLLSASRDEGFSYAIGEAMANGLPSVVSDIAAVAWARRGGSVFFTPGDTRAMVAAIDSVLGWTDGQREAAAHAGREYASRHLSLERWAARVAAVYRVACRTPSLARAGLVTAGNRPPV